MHFEDLNLISFEFLCGYGCLELIKMRFPFPSSSFDLETISIGDI
ncbi:hypothetical protein NC651_024485 [Populus alba x Populus x berolinensis]|nr:hypothetical protein NC651_024485 [Populus alba x Populus x berolinensis]